jgi:hypothetical protein
MSIFRQRWRAIGCSGEDSGFVFQRVNLLHQIRAHFSSGPRIPSAHAICAKRLQNCALLRRQAGTLAANGQDGHSAASQNFMAACSPTGINNGWAVITRFESKSRIFSDLVQQGGRHLVAFFLA